MIEEEDDEEILKKGISFKSVLKNLFIILLIVLGAMVIYLGGGEDPMANWMLGFLLICSGTTLMQIQKNPGEPIRQTLTILICSMCGITKVRNFEKGDFIFNKSVSDKCTKCQDIMEIKQIYSVKLKQPTEKDKKENASKKPDN